MIWKYILLINILNFNSHHYNYYYFLFFHIIHKIELNIKIIAYFFFLEL